MRKLISVGILLTCLTGCSMMQSKIEVTENGVTTSYTEKAYIAKVQFDAEKECYENINNNDSITDDMSAAQAVFLTASAFIDKLTNAKKCGGTNVNDVAVAKVNAWGSVGRAIPGALVSYKGIDALAGLGEAALNAASQPRGDINIGSISTSQNPSADSNDGGAEGSGSGVADASKEGDTIIVGHGNSTAQSRDQAGAFVDTSSTQRIGESATGAVNEDSNVDQQPVIDENNAEQSNQPENGGNSLLSF